jgi:hypothetical protein
MSCLKIDKTIPARDASVMLHNKEGETAETTITQIGTLLFKWISVDVVSFII